MVKKAVNWALREVGKRSAVLHPQALETARTIGSMQGRAPRWIASDAIRELNSVAVKMRFGLEL
jgi:3-methyladenine DNA glycosylase AlkD